MANADRNHASDEHADSDSILAHVQDACTGRHTGVARVTVAGDVGYWYFRRGAIMHALTLDLVGEEAALDMLSWQGGQWEACSRPWPQEQTVFISWVELFQRAGELQRAAAALEATPPVATTEPPRLSAFSRPPPRLFLAAPGGPEPVRVQPPPLSVSQLDLLAEAAIDFTVIDSEGRSRVVRGEARRLTELVSYGSQLGDRIGSLIGVGRCLAFEVSYPAHTLLIASNGSNTLGLTVPRGGELERVKHKLRI